MAGLIHSRCALVVAIVVAGAASSEAAKSPPPQGTATAATAIVSWSGDQSHPRGAWHTYGGHLVVFEDHYNSEGGINVLAKRLDDNGTPLSGTITIGGDSRRRSRPVPQGGVMSGDFGWLVGYELLYSATDQDIYARFVTASGGLPGQELPVAVSTYWEYEPAVAWGGSMADGWLVVWSRAPYPLEFQSDVWAAVVRMDGSVTTPVQITSDPGREDQVTAAYDATTDGWLVAWCDDLDIRGRRLGPEGTPLAPVFDIAVGAGSQKSPRLAASSHLPLIALAYQEDFGVSDGPHYVRVAIITATGVTTGPALASQGSRDAPGPDLAYAPVAKGWLAIWEQYYSAIDHDVYAKYFGPDMTAGESPRMIINSTNMEQQPALSCSTLPNVLAFWEDFRNTSLGGDVYGELLPVGCLEGAVFRGSAGDTGMPLTGVALQLWGSSDPIHVDDLLGMAISDFGSFSLGYFNPPACLQLFACTPTGSWAAGATSQDGTVVTSNWIRFSPVTIGWHPLNDFWLKESALVGVTDPGAPGRLAASDPWPNPATSEVSLRLSGGAADQDRMEVFDLRGRRVREIMAARSGDGIARWDGCLRDGKRAPAGVYWLRVSNGSESVGRRVVIGGR